MADAVNVQVKLSISSRGEMLPSGAAIWCVRFWVWTGNRGLLTQQAVFDSKASLFRQQAFMLQTQLLLLACCFVGDKWSLQLTGGLFCHKC